MYSGIRNTQKLLEKGIETTMSKKSKTAVQPLSENTRRAIIITAIILVAVIILSVALALILKPAQNTPSDNNSSSSGSSSLTIRNGDFYYTGSDDTAYPKTAQNWSRYGYEAVSGSSHGFETLSTNEKSVMGIVTTTTEGDGDTWNTVIEDLAAEGIEIGKNPGKPDSESEDDNVYMIATKEATTASILSDSFSVSSGKSVKITVHLNTEQITRGNAVIMLQKSTVSALAENWYAYNFNVANQNDWQELTFYIFNRDTGTKYIRLSVGLGNVYSGEEGLNLIDGQPITAEGVLFVDDITYEEVTANDYRETVDAEGASNSTAFKVIENEDIEDESKYLNWDLLEGKTEADVTTYTDAKEFADSEGGYSPFTNRDDFYKDAEKEDEETDPRHDVPTGFEIYKIGHNGTSVDKPIGFRLNVTDSDIATSVKGAHGGIVTLYSLWQKDHHHISFWARVDQTSGNKVAKLNIYVQSHNDNAAEGEDEWEDLDNGSWTAQVSNQEIDTDSNCGFIKYDIYIKPAAVEREISILVTLGNKDGTYSELETGNKLFPSGTLYITKPAYENISSKDYNNASGNTYSKKLDLIGESATTSVSNGSFSSLNNTAKQPSGWTAVFAGDNMLYRDGKGNDEINGINRLAEDVVGSQVERGFDQYVSYKNAGEGKDDNLDDEQKNVLLIKNNVATSFGYYSGDITLSARTIYVMSALVKANEGTHPYFYLLNTDTSLERSERLIATGKSLTENENSLGQAYASSELGNGWTRQYIVMITGDSTQTVRVALFNGSIDGKTLSMGNVYFDQVQLITLGSYSMSEDTDLQEGEEAEKYIVNWSMSSYKVNDKNLAVTDLLSKSQAELLVKVGALDLEGETAKDGVLSSLMVDSKFLPDEEAWNTMLTIPETPEDDGNEEEPAEEKNPVDWGLLLSVVSSIALVAALLVVVVVKMFKNRKNQKKAA